MKLTTLMNGSSVRFARGLNVDSATITGRSKTGNAFGSWTNDQREGQVIGPRGLNRDIRGGRKPNFINLLINERSSSTERPLELLAVPAGWVLACDSPSETTLLACQHPASWHELMTQMWGDGFETVINIPLDCKTHALSDTRVGRTLNHRTIKVA